MPETSPKPLTLLCLPCAGASAAMYSRWKRFLPELKIQPVELPGRGKRFKEKLIEDYNCLVNQLAEELIPSLPENYALFGHSMGGLLGYGLIRSLHRKGFHLPHSFLISACAAPSARDATRYANKEDRASLIKELHQQGGTPIEVFEHEELLDYTLQLLRADYRVCGSFRYSMEAPLPVPFYVLAGRKDTIEASRLEAWQQETCSHFSLEWFEGGHFFIQPQEAVIFSKIRQYTSSFIYSRPLKF